MLPPESHATDVVFILILGSIGAYQIISSYLRGYRERLLLELQIEVIQRFCDPSKTLTHTVILDGQQYSLTTQPIRGVETTKQDVREYTGNCATIE